MSFRLEAEKTKEREIAALLKVVDNFPKYIVTLDEFAIGITAEGIHVIHLREFLLTEWE